MAAIAMMIGSAVANAAAFIGGNAIYGLVNKSGSAEEMSRHNSATEDLQRAQADWSQKRQARLDFLNDQLRRANYADKSFADIDEAMRLYYEVTGGDEQKQKGIPDIGNEPTLDEFYQPSESKKSTSSSSSLVA